MNSLVLMVDAYICPMYVISSRTVKMGQMKAFVVRGNAKNMIGIFYTLCIVLINSFSDDSD